MGLSRSIALATLHMKVKALVKEKRLASLPLPDKRVSYTDKRGVTSKISAETMAEKLMAVGQGYLEMCDVTLHDVEQMIIDELKKTEAK